VRVRSAVAAALAAAALLAGLLAPASADDLDDQAGDIRQQIQATEDSLAGASARLKAAAAELARAQAQLPAARAAYVSAQSRLATSRAKLAAVRQKLRQLRAQQEQVQVEIDAAVDRIERSEVLIARIVRYQYQTGGYAELEVVLDAESPTDFVQRVMATKSVTDTQSEIIDQLNADKAVLAARQQQMEVTEEGISDIEADVERQVAKLQDLFERAAEARQAIEQLVRARSAAMQVAEEEKQAEQDRLARLEAQQDAIQAAIAQQSSTGSATGSLIWPMPGYSAGGGVGWRVHPVYGYRSCHTGVDIGAPSGTQIIAARGGTVVWTSSDLSGPYGNNTLIDHGNGLSTFYAHQSGFAVSPGERVSKGEVIGYVGSTGYSSGPHLHFEVHVNGVPYDPMGWFGGSKTPKSQFCPGS
jgi:murein DD-endopeptidase MepM/ murein hydrolase activator NlpD